MARQGCQFCDVDTPAGIDQERALKSFGGSLRLGRLGLSCVPGCLALLGWGFGLEHGMRPGGKRAGRSQRPKAGPAKNQKPRPGSHQPGILDTRCSAPRPASNSLDASRGATTRGTTTTSQFQRLLHPTVARSFRHMVPRPSANCCPRVMTLPVMVWGCAGQALGFQGPGQVPRPASPGLPLSPC